MQTHDKTIDELMDKSETILNEQYGVGCWHCDDLYEQENLPDCVQKFLDVKRASAYERLQTKVEPRLYADYNGKRVKINMASRFGDVGISHNLNIEYGYDDRVYLPDMSNFSTEP